MRITRPVNDAVAHTGWALEMDVAGHPLAELLPRQLSFAFDGTGTLSTRRFVPQSAAAAALLASPAGARLEQVLRGALSTLDGQTGLRLDGITLAADEPSLVLAQTLTQWQYHNDHPDSHGFPMPLPSDHTASQIRFHYQQVLDGNLEWIRSHGELGVADCDTHDWIDLGVPQSQALLAAAGAGAPPTLGGRDWASRAPHDLLRELQHVVTPPVTTADSYPPLAWLEDGSAETLASWPGAVAPFAAAMGIRVPDPAGVAYPNTTDHAAPAAAVRRLLALAGVDPARAGAAAAAAALLQGPRFDDVPAAMAAAIVAAHPGSGVAPAQLTQLIAASGGRPGDLDRIEQLVTA